MWRLIYTTWNNYYDNSNRPASDLEDVEIIEASTYKAVLEQFFEKIPESMIKKTAGKDLEYYEEVNVVALYKIEKDVKIPDIKQSRIFQKKVADMKKQMEEKAKQWEAKLQARKEEEDRKLYERLKKKYTRV